MMSVSDLLLRCHDDATSCDREMKKGRLWLLLALRIMRSVIELHLRCHDDVTSCDRNVKKCRL